MVSAGEGLKCQRVVHSVGREPEIRERECTPREVAGNKTTTKKTRTAQKQLSQIELERWKQYYRLVEQCEKKFGSTVCNR